MRMLNAGVIGLGVGEQHILGYQSHPRCRVTCICDTDELKLSEVRSRHPECRGVADVAVLLADPSIDVVSVASYDDVHAGQICAALRAGKHVFAEKPLCLSVAEGRAIRDALRENPQLRLSSNLVLRRCPRFRALRDMIRSGEMGEVYGVEADYNYGRLQKLTDGWRGRLANYSVTLGGGIHMVDLVLWLLGSQPETVTAFGNGICSAGRAACGTDFVMGLLHFPGGPVAKVTANFGCVQPHFHNLVVYGTKATFVQTHGTGHALLYTSRDPAEKPIRVEADYPGHSKSELVYGFVDAILGGQEPEVGAADVFRALSVGLALDEAWRRGQVTTVEYL